MTPAIDISIWVTRYIVEPIPNTDNGDRSWCDEFKFEFKFMRLNQI